MPIAQLLMMLLGGGLAQKGVESILPSLMPLLKKIPGGAMMGKSIPMMGTVPGALAGLVGGGLAGSLVAPDTEGPDNPRSLRDMAVALKQPPPMSDNERSLMAMLMQESEEPPTRLV